MKTVRGIAIHDGIVIGRLLRYCDGVFQRASFDFLPIVMAKSLSARDVMRLFDVGITSFVLDDCTETAHSAILARTAGEPSLYGVALPADCEGELAVLDGDRGLLILSPDTETLKDYEARLSAKQREEEALLTEKDRPALTKNGKRVALYANINTLSDLGRAIEYGAEGVFFKTEFLFLEKDRAPDEEEQFLIYRTVADRLDGRLAVIRTADIGADKKPTYLALDEEDNPALGLRGIRLSLQEPELFRTQLRAILRASSYGKVAVMLPMVSSCEEVLKAKEQLEVAKNELKQQKVAFDDNFLLGIMIETPAAALLSASLAEICDFFSVGTNDLTQYTLAVDRQNPKLKELFLPRHPAVLRAIEETAKAAKAAGIPIAISGELGSDENATALLLSLGIDRFAVAPSKLLTIKKKLAQIELR